MISIATLIYRSTSYADAVHDSLYEFTPKLHNGEAEFYFVANDASDGVIKHLTDKNYKFFINNNPKKTEQELFKMGIGWPEYIHRVYRGWNYAIEMASGDKVVLVNSDNMFSPLWLENLLKHLTNKTIVCSFNVEHEEGCYCRNHGATIGNFGKHPDKFDKEGFLKFCESHRKDEVLNGGLYMPCLFYKSVMESVGCYPEGNLCGRFFNEVKQWGDKHCFEKLSKIGVNHIVASDSLTYHFSEGEMRENVKNFKRK